MINVNQITAILERLPDAQLQQYAAMHKQDPYTLALAVEESNRRKRMRAAPQGQPQQQGEAPPVNEQAVQAMAPEDTGIATLPTGDMEFADGGIIAFAGGTGPGAVERRMTPEEQRQAYNRLALARVPAAAGDVLALPATAAWNAAALGSRGLGYLFGTPEMDYLSPTPLYDMVRRREAEIDSGIIPAEAAQPAAVEKAAKPSDDSARTSRSEASPQQPPAPGGAGGAGGRTGASISVPTPVSADPASYLEAARNRFAQDDPAAAEVAAARREQLNQLRAAHERYGAALPQGKASERLEEQLKKEEGEVGAKKEENLKMALINAGLGMMAGTSQYALTNIGAGAKQGVESFTKGKEKLEAAADKRRELFDKIDQARRAEQEGRARDKLALDKEVVQVDAQYRGMQIDGIRKMFGVAVDQAKAAVDAMTALERQRMSAETTLRAARISADASAQSTAKTAMMEYGKSLRLRYQELEKNMRDPLAKYDDNTKALFQGQMDSLMKEITNVEGQLAKLGGLTPPASPGPTGGQRTKFDAKGNPVQ